MIRPKCPIVLGQTQWFILNPTIFNLIARPFLPFFLESFWMDLRGELYYLSSPQLCTPVAARTFVVIGKDLLLEANQRTCINWFQAVQGFLFWCSTATCPQPLFLWNFSAESVQLPGRENKKVFFCWSVCWADWPRHAITGIRKQLFEDDFFLNLRHMEMRNPTSSKLIQRQEIRIGEYYRFFSTLLTNERLDDFPIIITSWNFEMCFILVIAWSESQKTVTKSLRGKKCVVKKQVSMDLFSRWFRILGCVFVVFFWRIATCYWFSQGVWWIDTTTAVRSYQL